MIGDPVGSLRLEQELIGAGDDLVERLLGSERRDPRAHPGIDLVSYDAGDCHEPVLDIVAIDAAKRTHKLIAAVADDRIEGAEVAPHCRYQHLENTIAGSVAALVVDLLHAINVCEGKNETAISAPRPLDLICHGQPAGISSPGSGQVIEVRFLQLPLQAEAVPRCACSVGRRPLPVDGRPCSSGGGVRPDLLKEVRDRNPRSREAPLEVAICVVSLPGGLVAPGSCLVAPGCRLIALSSRLVARDRRRGAVQPRCPSVGEHFGPGEPAGLAFEVLRSCAMSRTIGDQLVGSGRLLVANGVGDVAIGESLVAISESLVAIGQGLLAISKSLVAISGILIFAPALGHPSLYTGASWRAHILTFGHPSAAGGFSAARRHLEPSRLRTITSA